MKKTLAVHYIVDLYNCDEKMINSVNNISKIMNEAGIIGNLHIVENCFHQFSPQGVSGILILEESHFAIHTWPEYNYVSVDLYLCGDDNNVDSIVDYLKEVFKSNSIKRRVVYCGID